MEFDITGAGSSGSFNERASDNRALLKEEQDVLNNLLIEAIQKQDLDKVRHIMNKGADIKTQSGGNDVIWLATTPLNFKKEIVDELLARGANINSRHWSSQKTLLANAVVNRNEDKITYLLTKNPDLTIKDNDKKIALQLAYEISKDDYAAPRERIINMLLDHMPDAGLQGAKKTTAKEIPTAANDIKLPARNVRKPDDDSNKTTPGGGARSFKA